MLSGDYAAPYPWIGMQENGWGLLRTEPEGGGLTSFACRVAGLTAIMKRFIVLWASLLVAYFQKKIR